MRNLCEDVARRIKERSNPEVVLRILAEGMKEGWLMKKRQIAEVDIEVHDIIKKGISKGASAAKLCGAGGSGFVLFICDPESVNSVRNSFSQSQVVIPKVVNSGVSANEI